MVSLVYPKRQTIAFSNTLLKLYEEAKSIADNEITFDLSQSKLLTPLGIVLLTTTVTECHKNGKQCFYLPPHDQELKNFLTDVGFHQFFQLNGYGVVPEPKIESGNVQLQKRHGISPGLIETLIQILNYHLHISNAVKASLQMSLIEMMTNVIDHSGVQDYYVCCRNYPEKDEIRLCVTDMGVGIPTSLRKAAAYAKIRKDEELIEKATEQSVSSKLDRAGMGLHHIKQFLKSNEGQLCIMSGNGKVFWKFDQAKIQHQKMNTAYKGTIIKMVINTDKDWYYFLADEKDYLFS